MPFIRTSTPPSTNSTVTVEIAGLLALRPGANDSCEVGVHRFSRIHAFQVMLIVKKPTRPPRLIRLLSGPLTSDLEMSVVPNPGTGFRVFASAGASDPFNRAANPPDNAELALDHRWALNVRGLPNHHDADFNQGGRPLVKLNTGVLYTSTLTRPTLQIMLKCGETETNLHRIAADLAVAIELQGQSKFVIGWSEFGEPVDPVVLPRPRDPEGTIYTVVLLNDPPITNPPIHDELKEYYRILVRGNGSPIDPQCRLTVSEPQKTDEIPCLAVLLGP